jgi:hypothetical protein
MCFLGSGLHTFGEIEGIKNRDAFENENLLVYGK